MLSKMMSRMNQSQALVNNATRAFRASAVANKKPSIGDAVTILQSKVSGINQVVSTIGVFDANLSFHRMTSRNSELSSPLVMVLLESSVS